MAPVRRTLAVVGWHAQSYRKLWFGTVTVVVPQPDLLPRLDRSAARLARRPLEPRSRRPLVPPVRRAGAPRDDGDADGVERDHVPGDRGHQVASDVPRGRRDPGSRPGARLRDSRVGGGSHRRRGLALRRHRGDRRRLCVTARGARSARSAPVWARVRRRPGGNNVVRRGRPVARGHLPVRPRAAVSVLRHVLPGHAAPRLDRAARLGDPALARRRALPGPGFGIGRARRDGAARRLPRRPDRGGRRDRRPLDLEEAAGDEHARVGAPDRPARLARRAPVAPRRTERRKLARRLARVRLRLLRAALLPACARDRRRLARRRRRPRRRDDHVPRVRRTRAPGRIRDERRRLRVGERVLQAQVREDVRGRARDARSPSATSRSASFCTPCSGGRSTRSASSR